MCLCFRIKVQKKYTSFVPPTPYGHFTVVHFQEFTWVGQSQSSKCVWPFPNALGHVNPYAHHEEWRKCCKYIYIETPPLMFCVHSAEVWLNNAAFQFEVQTNTEPTWRIGSWCPHPLAHHHTHAPAQGASRQPWPHQRSPRCKGHQHCRLSPSQSRSDQAQGSGFQREHLTTKRVPIIDDPSTPTVYYQNWVLWMFMVLISMEISLTQLGRQTLKKLSLIQTFFFKNLPLIF